jgi:hypothetical protein
MNRRELVKLCAGVIGCLGSHRVIGGSVNVGSKDKNTLSDSYLVKGLTGMAKTKSWFGAHWGASILAGYYLCKENNLNDETAAAIKIQLDNIIRLRESQFAMLPKEPVNKALIEDVPKALSPAIQDGLRAHGHAVIFASLSTKALRDVPDMAQPTLINRLNELSRTIAKQRPKKPNGQTSYTDTQTMIEATFDSISRFKEVLGHPLVKRPNFTHMVTHTDALMNLEMMGYSDLVKAGHAGHRAHISAAVPRIEHRSHPKGNHVALEEVMSKGYWENEGNLARWNKKMDVTSNRNGDWVAAGHLFKVLYSYHRLIKRVKDKKKIRLCSMILLERYVNPDVQGG